jgi:hypothetical protein
VLIVDTVAHIDDTALAGLRSALFGRGCSNGLLFDANECVILHDTYTSDDPSSFAEDGRVSTDRLLARMPGGQALEPRVHDWLRTMSSSWNEALPAEPEVAGPFFTHIVTAVSGSSVLQVA